MKSKGAEWTASSFELAASRPRSGPAEVLAVRSARSVAIRFDRESETHEAQVALPSYDEPREGDRVLALVDDAGGAWIVGVIRAPRPRSLLEEALEHASVVEVRDRRGELLFEYDPETERAVLHVPEGDLELSVDRGALRFRARDGVSVETTGELAMQAAGVKVRGQRIELESSRGEASSARVALQPGELTLVGTVLTAAADRAEFLASKIGVKAHQLESHVDRVRSVAKVLDVRAGRIVERAKDVYREVSGLSQTRAGRLRLVAAKAAQLVGENTLLKARDRMKVKGERIHLA